MDDRSLPNFLKDLIVPDFFNMVFAVARAALASVGRASWDATEDFVTTSLEDPGREEMRGGKGRSAHLSVGGFGLRTRSQQRSMSEMRAFLT